MFNTESHHFLLHKQANTVKLQVSTFYVCSLVTCTAYGFDCVSLDASVFEILLLPVHHLTKNLQGMENQIVQADGRE